MMIYGDLSGDATMIDNDPQDRRTWNYRICRYKDGGYGLHEVYYEHGEPNGWTSEPTIHCDEDEGPAGIILSLELMLADAKRRVVLDLPVTWEELITGGGS